MWSSKKSSDAAPQANDEPLLSKSGGDDGSSPKKPKQPKAEGENKFFQKLMASGTATVGLAVAALTIYGLSRYKSKHLLLSPLPWKTLLLILY